MRKRLVFGLIVALMAVGAAPEAQAWRGCGRVGFVNRGFGYGWGVGRGWCGPRLCGPGFGWGYGFGYRPCVGWRSPWFGSCWPGCGGWYGGGFATGFESVYVSVPYGGGATFFSGSVVPYPVPIWAPYAVPPFWFGDAGQPRAALTAVAAAPMPVQAAPLPAPPPRAVAAAAPAPGLRRPVAAAARKRAAGLVAEGDRHLLASGGDRAGLTAAAAAYRRAVAAAADDPDLHIRHALVLTWLGRLEEAGQASARAVALDGRLAAAAPGHEPAVLVRGRRILQNLAAKLPEENAAARTTLAAIEERWMGGAASAPAATLAALSSTDR